MRLDDLIQVKFVERPNRFTVKFHYHNKEHLGHLKDPGRLKELLIPGIDLLVKKVPHNPNRKTKYDVVAVFKDRGWVLINSGFHSDLAEEAIKSRIIGDLKNYGVEKREYSFGKSRLDFLLSLKHNKDISPNISRKMLLEVKGCTLVENNTALFPDAPTIRGKKHLEELIEGIKQGFASGVIFLILKEDALVFSPNFKTDPDFSCTLQDASQKNVSIFPLVFKTHFKDNSLEIKPWKLVKLIFKKQ